MGGGFNLAISLVFSCKQWAAQNCVMAKCITRRCSREADHGLRKCDLCRASQRRWRDRHHARYVAIKERWRLSAKGKEKIRGQNLRATLKALYGLTVEAYNALLVGQSGRCALCLTATPGGGRSRFCVDHDHESGKVRGLLCVTCNTGLGLYRDSPDLLRAAATYLESHGTKGAVQAVLEERRL
jgi:Recombination endonuclease VII